ncbi:hypothetical protein [Shinella sp. BYT-45]|uniref:hypothetical protein n=1 Tax=Shinella sp. BYT-45 TaxID=3377377 RepID=UPI00397F3BEE
MPKAALAVTVTMPTAAAFFARGGDRRGTSAGCRIEAAAPAGGRDTVFMQNDTSAQACGFVTATAQCRQIN